MNKKAMALVLVIVMFCFFPRFSLAEELPRPTYDNSLILSVSYSLDTAPPAEVEYVKSQFANGLYSWLSFSAFLSLNMPKSTECLFRLSLAADHQPNPNPAQAPRASAPWRPGKN